MHRFKNRWQIFSLQTGGPRGDQHASIPFTSIWTYKWNLRGKYSKLQEIENLGLVREPQTRSRNMKPVMAVTCDSYWNVNYVDHNGKGQESDPTGLLQKWGSQTLVRMVQSIYGVSFGACPYVWQWRKTQPFCYFSNIRLVLVGCHICHLCLPMTLLITSVYLFLFFWHAQM